MTVSKLDRAEVEALWDQHASGVRHFVLGVLRDADQADEALQQTFVTVLEQGHAAAEDTQKGWIFKVAFHHAMQLKRRAATGDRALGKVQDALRTLPQASDSAADSAMRSETIERTRAGIDELPEAQQRVVHMRLHEAKTFQQIADELAIPLSTALTRMRLAMTKLRDALG